MSDDDAIDDLIQRLQGAEMRLTHSNPDLAKLIAAAHWRIGGLRAERDMARSGEKFLQKRLDAAQAALSGITG